LSLAPPFSRLKYQRHGVKTKILLYFPTENFDDLFVIIFSRIRESFFDLLFKLTSAPVSIKRMTFKTSLALIASKSSLSNVFTY